MAKEEMIPILKAVGATEWLNAGFKGQGIRVWNIESDYNHGANSRQMVIDVAPEVEMYSNSFSFSADSNKLLSEPKTESGLSVMDYAKQNNIDIITSSQAGNCRASDWIKYVGDMIKSTNVLILNCAFNNGVGDGETISTKFPYEHCIIMGALNYTSGKFLRASYSSVGKELDFSQSVGWWAGTSASTPFQAGMCAIIMSRYGRMSMQEMYKYLQMIAKDLGTAGHDTYHGWGQPILPPLSKKYITMTTTSNKYKVDGKEKVMDTKPVNKQGNVFVPIRVISEALGKKVDWATNPDKSIKVTIDGRIILNTGSEVAFIDGKKQYLNFAPYIDSNNRTMVPIRFVAEALNCKVDWVQPESKVIILEV